jgi:hypothetical protein
MRIDSNRIHVMLAVFAFAAFLYLPGDVAFAQDSDGEIKEYIVEVKGTEGAKYKMLLITRSISDGGLTKEMADVELPFKKKFKTQSYYMWLDYIPVKDKEGKTYKYMIEETINGTNRMSSAGSHKSNIELHLKFGNL